LVLQHPGNDWRIPEKAAPNFPTVFRAARGPGNFTISSSLPPTIILIFGPKTAIVAEWASEAGGGGAPRRSDLPRTDLRRAIVYAVSRDEPSQ
jgi:hypothetical protein